MQKTVSISRELKATRRRENVAGYLFMAPSLLFFLGFVIFPMGMCLVTSAFNYTMTDFSFIGLQNYAELFSDAIFGKSLVNTVIIVVASVPTVCFFSLWVVTGSVAVTVVWKWMFNPYYGLLNYVFKELGILSRNLNWLGSPDTALWCIILILFTTSIGQPIVLYVSALSNVDHSLVEAAEVDGATNMQVFWRIKWPQIMPTTLYILVITTINSFQCFALIQLLTKGGPLNSTMTIMYQVYDTAYRLNDLGYACAIGVVLALIIAIFSAIQFKVAKTDN